MAWYDFITGSNPVAGATEGAVKGVIEGIGFAGDKVYAWVKGELPPEKQAEFDLKYQELTQKLQEGNQAINLADAQSGSNFRGGWRPAIGWTCAMALWFYYVPPVFMATLLWTVQCIAVMWQAPNIAIVKLPDFPLVLNIQEIIGLVASLLGLAGLRSIEKTKSGCK